MVSSDDILIATIEILATNCTDKTSNMVDGVPGSHNKVVWIEALAATATFNTKPTFVITSAQKPSFFVITRISQWGVAFGAKKAIFMPG